MYWLFSWLLSSLMMTKNIHWKYSLKICTCSEWAKEPSMPLDWNSWKSGCLSGDMIQKEDKERHEQKQKTKNKKTKKRWQHMKWKLNKRRSFSICFQFDSILESWDSPSPSRDSNNKDAWDFPGVGYESENDWEIWTVIIQTLRRKWSKKRLNNGSIDLSYFCSVSWELTAGKIDYMTGLFSAQLIYEAVSVIGDLI